MQAARYMRFWLLALIVLPQHASTAGVVGFPQAKANAFVALRGRVLRGTTVTGIQFYSNDATVFPEVLLAADEGELTLPEPGIALRSERDVHGSPGYVTVALDPYQVIEDQNVWAMVRFPSDMGLHAKGLGGGPGIGWCAARRIDGERSFFGVGLALNEFAPAFDITLVLSNSAGIGAAKAEQDPLDDHGSGSPISRIVTTLDGSREEGSNIQFLLGRAGNVNLTVYDVSGRLVRTLARGELASGTHQLRWDCRNGRGSWVACGVYFVVLRTEYGLVSSKLVLIQ